MDLRSIDLARVDHVLSTTRAVRKRLDLQRPVEREILERCIEIATQAPTGPEERAMGWYYYLEDRLRFPLRPDASLPRSFRRSAQVKPSASSAWHPKMRAAPTSS